MTRLAHTELDDVRRIVSRLESGQSGDCCNADYKAAITQLRAVGHKLSRSDESISLGAKEVFKHHFYSRCCTNPYFQKLKCERDRVLKDRVLPLRVVSERVESKTAQLSMLRGPMELGLPRGSHFRTAYRYFVTSGPFQGMDAIHVLVQGIRFWEIEISWLERRLASIEQAQIRQSLKVSSKPESSGHSAYGEHKALVEPSIASCLLAEMRRAHLAGLTLSEQEMRGVGLVRSWSPGIDIDAALRVVRAVTYPSELCGD